MQSVSPSYNPYPDERWANIRAVFELIDTTAAEDATPTATSEAEISKIEQSHNRILEMDKKLAALEHNYFILDGSFNLPQEDNGEVGWWSGSLSDSNGQINEVLEFNFTEHHSSVGFTIIFDEKANEYAKDFKIEIFDASNSLLGEDNVVGNTMSRYISETPTEGYSKVRLTFTKTPRPYRRIRISEVVFGIIQTFDKNNTTDLRLLYEISPSMENLPSNELTVTIENTDGKYNMINPKGIYRYLQDGQGLNVEIGIGNKRDNLEYVNMGRFYYTSAIASDYSMSAQITANDPIYALDRGLYRKGRNNIGTVAEIVTDILDDSGLDLLVYIPTEIGSRVIGWYLPIVSHREALRLVAQAAMSCCYWDRKDTLIFTELIEDEPVGTLGHSNMVAPAQVEIADYINAVEVGYYSLRDPDLTDDEIYKDLVTVNGTKTLWVAHGAAKSITASVNSGTVDSAEHYLYASKLTITAPGDVILTLTGRGLDISESFYRLEQPDGNPESIKRVTNPLVHSAIAPDFAAWLLSNAKKRLAYNLDERGNPAREIADTVKIYDAYNENRNAIITKQEYLYDGTLRANTEAWGGGI